MAETAFSAVEHALENQPVGGLQIRECGFDSRPDLQSINGIGDVSNFHIRVCTFTFNRCRRMNRQEKARRVLEPRGQVFHVRDFGLVGSSIP